MLNPPKREIIAPQRWSHEACSNPADSHCFFVIEHARRRILHFHVTAHPNSDWVVQQLREAFPDSTPYRFVIVDRDTNFDAEVLNVLRSIGLKPKRTSRESPWQNGVAERWVGSCRRELLDHVIPLNERHLRRLVRDYVRITIWTARTMGSAKTPPIGVPLRTTLAAERRSFRSSV